MTFLLYHASKLFQSYPLPKGTKPRQIITPAKQLNFGKVMIEKGSSLLPDIYKMPDKFLNQATNSRHLLMKRITISCFAIIPYFYKN